MGTRRSNRRPPSTGQNMEHGLGLNRHLHIQIPTYDENMNINNRLKSRMTSELKMCSAHIAERSESGQSTSCSGREKGAGREAGGWYSDLAGAAAGRRRLRRLVAVHEHGQQHQRRAQRKLHRQLEVEHVDGYDAGDDDGQRGGEALQNVVGVLDHDSYQESSHSVLQDDEPHPDVEPKQQAVGGDLLAVAEKARYQGQRQRQWAQLDVSDPDAHVGPFQDLLKVDAGEPREEARSQSGTEAHQPTLLGRGGGGGGGGRLGLR